MPSTTTADVRSIRGLVSVDDRTFPLRATRIHGRADGGLAATTLVQEYGNPYPEPLEVIYTMPLPADGAVLGFTCRLGERVVRGEIRRRAEAREAFRKALEEGRTAGLLEQERADVFTQSLGNLPPGCDVRVEIEVLHPLSFREAATSGELPAWEYRFPTVTGVRYTGSSGRVQDAGALEPPRADAAGTPVRLEVDLLVADRAAASLHSPSHEIVVATEHDGTRIALTAAARLDRDFVLRWAASRSEVGLGLSEGPGLEGDRGRYGILTITPPATPAAAFARDLTILLDASGSMSGSPIRQAVEVVEELLASLEAGDRFEILAFSNTVRQLTKGPVHASRDNLSAAIVQLRAMSAGGGTEMATALLGALATLREDSQRQVVLVTDGLIGFEQEVVREILERLPANARLHVVGIGAAPNRTLTRCAARAGRGTELLVTPGEHARSAASRLCSALAAPILTDLGVRGSAVTGVAPARPPDVYRGRPILLPVELAPAGGTIELEASLAGSREPWRRRIEVPAASEGEGHVTLPLGAFYGRERVEDAEMLLAASRSELEETMEEIATIALRHRIVSRATSLVAISEEPAVDPKDPRRRERVVTEIPAGVSAEAAGYGETNQFFGVVAGAMTSSTPPASLMASLAQMITQRPDPAADAASGRIVGVEGNLLIVEAEVPPAGLEVPADGSSIDVILRDCTHVQGIVVGDRSTRPGRHAPALVVRIALQLPDGISGVAALILRWLVGPVAFMIVIEP